MLDKEQREALTKINMNLTQQTVIQPNWSDYTQRKYFIDFNETTGYGVDMTLKYQQIGVTYGDYDACLHTIENFKTELDLVLSEA